MTATTTTARKSTSTRTPRKSVTSKAVSARRQMEDAVIETMKEAQAAKDAAPKSATRKAPVRKTTAAKATPKTSPKVAPKTSAKAAVSSVTKREVSASQWSFAGYELRSTVDDVVAKWGTKIPLVHDADGRCKSTAGLTDHKDRAWLEAAWSNNAALAATGKTRTFGFCANCVSVKSAVADKAKATAPKRVVDLTPVEVEIDLSAEPTAEATIAAIDAEVMPGNAEFLAKARAEENVARVAAESASILNDEDDSDLELAEIRAEVDAQLAAEATHPVVVPVPDGDVPATVRKPRAPRKPRTV